MGESDGRDLEVPAEVGAGRLAELLAAAVPVPPDAPGTGYRIEAQPLGRLLAPHESLADAGVWDGAWLILHPGGAAPAAAAPATAPPGWTPLGIDIPPAVGTDDAPPASAPGDGFVWKR